MSTAKKRRFPKIPEPARPLIHHPDRVSVTFRIRCRREYHWASIINGNLVLLNHDVQRERNMVALGGVRCECLALLDNLQKGYVPSNPPEVSIYRHKHWLPKEAQRRYSRELVTSECDFAPYFRFDAPSPIEPRTYKLLWRLLKYRCKYSLLSSTKWILNVVSGPTGHPSRPGSIDGYGRQPNTVSRASPGHTHCLVVGISIASNWMQSVWKRGLAVVEGHLVLWVGDDIQIVESHLAQFRYLKYAEAVVLVDDGLSLTTKHVTLGQHPILAECKLKPSITSWM